MTCGVPLPSPQSDPLWRLPLHAPYRRLMDSKVADISSTGPAEGGGGAILAALFMAEFVKDVPRCVGVTQHTATRVNDTCMPAPCSEALQPRHTSVCLLPQVLSMGIDSIQYAMARYSVPCSYVSC